MIYFFRLIEYHLVIQSTDQYSYLLNFYGYISTANIQLLNRTMAQMRKRLSSDKNNEENTGNKSSQDWVCLKCNNLNYSFRSKCNRCKIQSRENNHQQLYADYYYYNQYYTYQNTQHVATGQPTQHSFPSIEGIQSPQKSTLSENWMNSQ